MAQFCEQCGAPVKEGSKFCTSCGAKVFTEPTPAPVVREPVPPEPDIAEPVFTAPAAEPVIPEPVTPAYQEPTMPADQEPTAPVYQQPASPMGDWQQPQTQVPPTAVPRGETASQQSPANAHPYGAVPQRPLNTPQYGMPPQPGSAAGQKKKPKKGLIIGIVAAVVVLLGAAAAWWFLIYNAVTEIDVTPYVSASFSGVDGFGRAAPLMDQMRFVQDVSAKLKTDNPQEDAQALMNTVARCCSLDRTDALRNGDTVSVVWSEAALAQLNETIKDFKIKVAAQNSSVTVSGLVEAVPYDPFRSVDVTFTGVSGAGSVVLTQKTDQYSAALRFTTTAENVSNGDTVVVTVTADPDDILAQNYGITLSRRTAEYTVSGLEDVPAQDVFEGFFGGTDGYSPTAVLTVTVAEDAPEWAYDLVPERDRWENVKNGDEITVRLSYRDSEEAFIRKYGFRPESLERILTVDWLDELVTDAGQITGRVLVAIQDAVVEKNSSLTSSFHEDGFRYVGFYFGRHIEGRNDEYGESFVVPVYACTVSDDEGKSLTYGNLFLIDGLVISPDGECEFDDVYFLNLDGVTTSFDNVLLNGKRTSFDLYGPADPYDDTLGDEILATLEATGDYTIEAHLSRAP